MPDFQLTLTDDERQYLLELLNAEIGDTSAEVHHTRSSDFRERVRAQKDLLRELVAKLEK